MNKLSKLLLGCLAFGLLLALLGAFRGKSDPVAEANAAGNADAGPQLAASQPAPKPSAVSELEGRVEPAQVEPAERAKLGIEATADTAAEVMRVLMVKLQNVQDEMKAVRTHNDALQKRLDDTERKLEEGGAAASSADVAELERQQDAWKRKTDEANAVLEELKRKAGGLTQQASTLAGQVATGGLGNDIPIGLGLGQGGYAAPASTAGGIVWIEPVDQPLDPQGKPLVDGQGKPVLPTIKIPGSEVFASRFDQLAGNLAPQPPEPVYTVNRDATLMSSVGMTALIGRIPVGGAVQDPYPFKLLVGEDNLAANGIHIPGIAGMVISGRATGDWNLSCVRGEIFSATFVFEDGTIRSFPKPESGDKPEARSTQPFGYLSDEFGIPCVSGERLTNAASYISSRVLMSAAQGYANARAQAETTTSDNLAGGTNRAVTGDPGAFARGLGIANGLKEVGDWLDARQQNSFDAIFVPSGSAVAIHIEAEIPIDYNPHGRKVDHHANAQPRRTRLD